MNTDRKFRSADQPEDMTLKTNRETTKENVSPKKSISGANPKHFTRDQAQTINSISTESNLNKKSNNFDVTTDLKSEKQLDYKYQ